MDYDDIRAAVTASWAQTDVLRAEAGAVVQRVAATQADARRLRAAAAARRLRATAADTYERTRSAGTNRLPI
jgi:hypothetical protein